MGPHGENRPLAANGPLEKLREVRDRLLEEVDLRIRQLQDAVQRQLGRDRKPVPVPKEGRQPESRR